MGYIVKSALVQVRMADGSYQHVYQGAPLPADADAEHVSVLVEGGMVERGHESRVEALEQPEDVEQPAGNASHDEWAAYAIAQGMSEEEAEGLSRNELRARFE